MTDPGCKPIDKWRVLDLGIITAGAATSAILADFGADVIKVESQSYQDPFRKWAGKWNLGTAISPVFQFTNRNKRGLDLDLKTSVGRERFLRLVAKSDVVVENFRRGVLDRLNLGYEVLAEANPRIVLASLSSQGDSGPHRGYASYGSTLDANGGLAAITGYPGDHPVVSGRNVNYTDQLVALLAAGTIIAGVMHAQASGKGAHLDISQREVTAFGVGEYVAAAAINPVESAQLRRGNADPAGLPQGCFRSADGHWLAVTVPSNAVPAVCARLAVSHRDGAGIEAALEAWIAGERVETVSRDLAGMGASVAPVLTGSEILNSNIGSVQRIFVKGPSGDFVKGSPFQQESPFSVHRDAPAFGEHTRDVLKELLGIDEQDCVAGQPVD